MISDTTVDLSVCSSQQQSAAVASTHTQKKKKPIRHTQKRESDSQSSKLIKAFALFAAAKNLAAFPRSS